MGIYTSTHFVASVGVCPPFKNIRRSREESWGGERGGGEGKERGEGRERIPGKNQGFVIDTFGSPLPPVS